MLTYILAEIIACEFKKNDLSSQGRKPENERRAMFVPFRLSPDYKKHNGDGRLEILIYGQSNYVQVWTRAQWLLTPVVADSPATNSDTGWVLKGDHDSGWREAILNVIREYKDMFSVLGDFTNEWAKIIPVPEWQPARYLEEHKRRTSRN